LPLASRRAVWGSGKSNRACCGDTAHAGEDADARVAAVAIDPGASARADNDAKRPVAAKAPKIAARRKKPRLKKTWLKKAWQKKTRPCMICVSCPVGSAACVY